MPEECVASFMLHSVSHFPELTDDKQWNVKPSKKNDKNQPEDVCSRESHMMERIIIIIMMMMMRKTWRFESSSFSDRVLQASKFEGVVECYDTRFWAMVPGCIVGTLSLRVRENETKLN